MINNIEEISSFMNKTYCTYIDPTVASQKILIQFDLSKKLEIVRGSLFAFRNVEYSRHSQKSNPIRATPIK